MKCYNIKYIKDSKELIIICSEPSLNMIKRDIENMGGNIISIEELKQKKEKDPVKTEIYKYYVSRFNVFYKRHKNKKISTQEFNEIKVKLKELKNNAKDKTELQEKFEKYLNNKDIKG